MSILTRATNGAMSAHDARTLALIIIAGGGFSFVMGLAYLVVALLQNHQGMTEDEIGYTSAAVGLGLIASAFFIPALARRAGYRLTILVTGFGAALLLIAMIWAESFSIWAILRFIMAIFAAGIFIATEAWMNELLPDVIRGRVVGIYAAMLSVTFAVGPAIAPLIGYIPPWPFILAAGVIGASALLVIPLAAQDVKPSKEEKAPILPIIASAPTIYIAIFSIGFFEAAGFGLFPIYVINAGHSEAVASYLFTAMAVGSTVLQPLIGYAADKSTPRKILIASALVSLTLCLTVPYLDLSSPLGFFVAAVIGGTSFGLYTLALTELGRRFNGAKLTSAMAVTAIAWGAGATIGPAIIGPLMEHYHDDWLFYILSFMYGALVLIAFLRGAGRSARQGSGHRPEQGETRDRAQDASDAP